MLSYTYCIFFETGCEISSDNRIALMFSCMLRPQPTGVTGNEFAKNQNSVALPSILTTYGHVDKGQKRQIPPNFLSFSNLICCLTYLTSGDGLNSSYVS
jgi:hypothetical protein